MKKCLLCLLLLVMLTCEAYARVQYRYDAAGNRIEKEIFFTAIKSSKSNTEDNEILSDMLREREIKIYPNPTHGMLKISINPFELEDECFISVSSMSGNSIIQTTVTEDITEIDLSTCEKGVYLLLIVLNEEKTIWKIIKD